MPLHSESKIPRKSYSLQQHIFRRFGALFSAAILLGCLSYALFVLHPRIERQALEHFSRSAQQVERSLLQLFYPTRKYVRTAAQWAEATTDSAGFGASLNQLFFPLLQNNAPITSVVAGTPDGHGYMLLQHPEGTWLNRFTDIQARGAEQIFVRYSDDGKEMSTNTREVDYDHRRRPWYRKAMAAEPGELSWTAPYKLFTTGDLGITVSTRVNGDDGSSFVLGLDVMLHDISAFTTTHHIGNRGFMLMLTDDLHLVGYPPVDVSSRDISAITGLEEVQELGSDVVDSGLASWEERGRQSDALYRFSSAGQGWYAKISPFQLGDQRFWIAMFAPQQDFAPAWGLVVASMLGLILVALGLVLMATRRMAYKLAAPLASVAASSEAVAHMNFSTPEFSHCNIREIEQLVHSHTRMSSLIQKSLATVEAQKKELSENVKELHTTRDRLRENEIKLQQNLNYVQAFFDSPLMGIALVQNRTITDCNRTFCALSGFAPSEVKGMATRNLYVYQHDYERVGREAASRFKEGKMYTTELLLSTRNGTQMRVHISGCLFDFENPQKGSMWIAIPVAEESSADDIQKL
ncbi:MAG: PAS domain S-box protein [Thermodesulfobacteriota bacterium]